MNLQCEELESRNLLSVLSVLNLNDSGPDSFRQALLDSQNGDTIQFAVSGTIQLQNELPEIDKSLLIDGFSAPNSKRNDSLTSDNAIRGITLDGSLLPPGAIGLHTGDVSNFVIDGFAFQHFSGIVNGSTSSGANISLAGSFNKVEGCYSADNGSGIVVTGQNCTIGGLLPSQRNTVVSASAFGIFLDGVFNTIENNLIGNDGILPIPNLLDGIHVEGSNNTVSGNVISGNNINGVAVSQGTGNLIENNMIGTDGTGSFSISNNEGINFAGNETANTATGNLISSNRADGILISSGDSTLNIIQGNVIGTDLSGLRPMGNAGYGIDIDSGGVGASLHNIIGGPIPGQGNIIAFNQRGGVIIVDTASVGNTIDPDSIYSNGGKGITLLNSSNGGISPPVLSSVVSDGTSLSITGFVTGNATLEFFSNQIPASEGKEFIGRATVGGNFHLSFPVRSGGFVTATATDSNGNTSEFSLSLSIASPVETANPLHPQLVDGFFSLLSEQQLSTLREQYIVFALESIRREEREEGISSISAIEESECCKISSGVDDEDFDEDDFSDLLTGKINTALSVFSGTEKEVSDEIPEMLRV